MKIVFYYFVGEYGAGSFLVCYVFMLCMCHQINLFYDPTIIVCRRFNNFTGMFAVHYHSPSYHDYEIQKH